MTAPGPQPEYFTTELFDDLRTIWMRWQASDDQPVREYALTAGPVAEVDELIQTLREHDVVHLTNGTRCGWRDQYAAAAGSNQ